MKVEKRFLNKIMQMKTKKKKREKKEKNNRLGENVRKY